jgi:hypothetical protein
VVGVVPALTEAEDGHDGVVAALVVALERAGAEHVTDRVDRPGDVVEEEDPDEAPPQEPGERARERHRQQATEDGRGDERGQQEPREGPVDPHDRLLAEQVRRPGLLDGGVGGEHPPAWACHIPRSIPLSPSSKSTWGEWGSPTSSV